MKSVLLTPTRRLVNRMPLNTTSVDELMPPKDDCGCGHGCSISSCRGRTRERVTLAPTEWDGKMVAGLNRIMEYQYEPLIERMVDQVGWTEEHARRVFDDLKRFMFLCGTVVDLIAAPRIIDDMWHEFMMFSQEYRSFCSLYVGFFVDHTPKLRDERISIDVPLSTLSHAMKAFGELSPNWRFPSTQEDKALVR